MTGLSLSHNYVNDIFTRKRYRKFKDEKIPILCPTKYHIEYYKPLLQSSVLSKYPAFMITSILDYVSGELDQTEEKKFYESPLANQLKFVLDRSVSDWTMPAFDLDNLTEDKFKQHLDDKNLYSSVTKDGLSIRVCQSDIIDKNTMTLKECIDIVKDFEYDAEKEAKDRNFESIWYWEFYEHDRWEGGYSYYQLIGQLNSNKYKKKIYLEIYITAESNMNALAMPMNYTLTFKFSDSVEVFWCDGIEWKKFDKFQIEQFHIVDKLDAKEKDHFANFL